MNRRDLLKSVAAFAVTLPFAGLRLPDSEPESVITGIGRGSPLILDNQCLRKRWDEERAIDYYHEPPFYSVYPLWETYDPFEKDILPFSAENEI